MEGINEDKTNKAEPDVKDNAKKTEKKADDIRATNRHRLLKKRQQERRSFQEKHNLVKIRRQPESVESSAVYNFNPVIKQQQLDDIKKERLPTLSATTRDARKQASASEVNILESVEALASKVSEVENKMLGTWKRLPNTSSAAASRPVLDPINYNQLGGSKEEVPALHFRTTLPALFSKPNEQTFRDVIYCKQEDALRQLIRLRRDQKTLTTGELNHALLIAINRGESKLAEILLMSGAEASAFSQYNPLLIQAAFTNNADIVRLLLQFGADPNLQKEPQYTSLYFACHRNNFEMAQVLVKAGADVTLLSRDKLTHLMVAARAGNLKCVRYLLFHFKGNINDKDALGKTAMHYAASSGKIRIVQTLIKHGAKTFVADNTNITPYATALSCHNSELAESLLPGNINEALEDIESGHSYTMLGYAVKSGHFSATQNLIKKGASTDVANQGNPFPIIKYSLEQKNLTIIKELVPFTDLSLPVHVDNDAPLNAVQYFTHCCASSTASDNTEISDHDFKILKYLVENGSDINAPLSSVGSVLLMVLREATSSRFKVKPILELGANPNMMREDGTTALWLACSSDHVCELVPLLIKHNFDMTMSDLVGDDGRSAMQYLLAHHRLLRLMKHHHRTLVHLVSAGASLGGVREAVDKLIGENPGSQTSDGANAGQTSDNDTDDSSDQERTDKMLLSILRKKAITPKPLQELSKLAIKKRLSHVNVDHDIERLPLPPAVKDYLKPHYIDSYFAPFWEES